MGKHHEGDPELAALGLVDGQRVDKFEGISSLVAKLASPTSVLVAKLAHEFNFQLQGRALGLRTWPLVLADHDTLVSLGDVRLALGRRPYVAPWNCLLKETTVVVRIATEFGGASTAQQIPY